MRLRRSPSRLLAVLTATAAAAAVVTVSTPVAAASASVSPLVTAAPATITLITGDTVTVSKDSTGRTSVDVTPHPGADAFTYTTQQDKNGYYLIPNDAAPFVASGVLDRQLFNLNYLAANGYADNATTAVPVIVQYQQDMTAPELDRKASAIPGSSDRRSLPSINSAAVEVAKDQAAPFWDKAGVAKVWLDQKVKALDDVSNAQIGAPTAWAAGHDGTGATVGIIDTGVDATHPDLAGDIVASHNFVEAGFPGGGAPEDVTDRHGHGTHVASTIAGSGVASGGKYEGVAPGTDLVIAKALDDTGSGTNSAIIAAMEWEAATEHVDVISMSLGGGPTDGTDPLSTAVNELTAQYGTLFVIAAGNSGPGDFTVAAPGAATSALTVGAVDSHDKIADFSSRGPRVGDLAIKPEITAPGVGIIAARAAGTSLGTPLNDKYTAASGTSMATPHVAAAAGILAAEHKDWTPEQLKAALTGTAADGGFSAYEQGAGRLDIGRAATQQVFDDTASISAKVSYPYDGQAVTKTVTYRNTGTSPVTLDVAATLTHDGSPAPAGMAKVSTPTVTVAPGATTSIDLTLDPAVATPGWYDGKLVASDGANHLTVPIALWLQAEQDMVHLQLVGDPSWTMSATYANAALMSDTDPKYAGEPVAKLIAWHATGKPNTLEATVSLAHGGTYSLSTSLFWYGADRRVQYGQAIQPEVKVDGAKTVVFDATKLARVNISTEQPSETAMASYFYYQTAASGTLYTGGSVLSYPAIAPGGYWISPAKKPTIGTFGFLADETRIAPQVSLSVPGLSLHPRYVTDRADLLPKFTADQRVGFANEQDLRAGKDVKGKLVFLTSPAPIATLLSDLDLATAHGAAGVVTSNYLAWILYAGSGPDHAKIPVLALTPEEATQLGKKLPRSATVHAQVTSPYEYKSVYYLRNGIPAKVDLKSRDRDMAKVDTTYHARFPSKQGAWGPIPVFSEVQHTYVPGQPLSIRGSHAFSAPAARTEYYTVPGDDVTWNRSYRFYDLATATERDAASYRGFTRGSKDKEDWNETAVPTQAVAGKDLPATGQVQVICDSCRQGDKLRLRSLSGVGLGQFGDASDASHQSAAEAGTEEVHLYREGTEVAPVYDAYGLPSYDVPAGKATYRLTDTYKDGWAAPHGGSTVTTDWTFQSSRPKKNTVAAPYACIDSLLFNVTDVCAWQPLIQLSHDLNLPGDDTARAGRPFSFTVAARVGATPIALRDLKVWISPDGGKNWTRTTVTRCDDAYTVSVTNPRAAGAVSLKIEATDHDGNSVKQTVADAYLVR